MRSRSSICSCLMIPVWVCLSASTGGWLAAAESPVEMRYDFRVGDHLIYREQTARTVRGEGFEYETLTRCTGHVLVMPPNDNGFLVAIQRAGITVELLRYTEEGKDRTERERPNFSDPSDPRLVPRAEVNRFDDHGWPALPWSAIREVTSEYLPFVHEIEGLPAMPVGEGSSWEGVSSLDMTFRWAGRERIGEADCIRVEGTSSIPGLTIAFWYTPSAELLQKVVYTASYAVPHAQVSERWTAELVERRRGEDQWLAQSDTRLGVLASCMIDDALPAAPTTIYPLLDSGDAATQRAVLSLAYARRLEPPSATQLSALAGSPDFMVRRLAVRMLDSVPKDTARPVIERAIREEDPFIADAVVGWARRRAPADRRASLASPADVLRNYDVLSNLPLQQPAQIAGPSSAASCAGLTGSHAAADGRPRIVPGATLRPMASPGYKGWPYILYVPDDYRGDEPFPLLVYLSGGPGRARMGLAASLPHAMRTGYILLFPQARQFWWDDWTPMMIESLIKELETVCSIDTNRVYASGWSNGGTGAFTLATVAPHRLAAAVSLMGAGVFVGYGKPPVAANADNVPLLFLHGDHDATITPRATQDTVERLRQLRRFAPLDMRILKGRDHDLNMVQDGDLLFPFLRKHVRNPFPRRIEFEIETAPSLRHYWVRIDEKGTGPAHVSGEIRDDNTIVLTARNVQAMRLLLRPELLPKPGTPIHVQANGRTVFDGPLQADDALFERSRLQEVDPCLAYSTEITVRIESD